MRILKPIKKIKLKYEKWSNNRKREWIRNHLNALYVENVIIKESVLRQEYKQVFQEKKLEYLSNSMEELMDEIKELKTRQRKFTNAKTRNAQKNTRSH